MQRTVEILTYTFHPGSHAALEQVMSDVSVPLHRAHGIDVVWWGPSRHDRDRYGLIRAFADDAEMDESLSAFYGSVEWRAGPREEIVAMISTTARLVLTLDDAVIEGMRR